MKLKEHTLLPEMQFLCACCRVNPTAADMATQTALAPVVDMERLVALARRQRVEPLLYHHLQRNGSVAWDGRLRDALAKRVRRSAEKSLSSIRLNIELALAMREQGIGFLPFKGVTLAQRYYGNISLRHANDIDFWVPERGIEPMRKLLSDLGGKVAPGAGFREIERGERHTRFLRRQYCEEVWTMPDGQLVEIHWRLTFNPHALRLNPADILESGEKVLFGGHGLAAMGSVPLLLYLCEHGARHGWSRLKWLFDLPQVLEGNCWDWEEVLSAAKRANCRSSLLLGLKLAEILFGWSAPEQVSRALQGHRFLDWQVSFVLKKMKSEVKALVFPTVVQRLKHLLYRASLIESPVFVWREIIYYALSQNDLRILKLPDRWFPLYYFLRPVLIWCEIDKVRRARER